MKRFRHTIGLLLFGALSLQLIVDAFAQGVAVPKRTSRPQPGPKLKTPVPKVQFQDVAGKARLSARHVTGSDIEKKYILETTGSGVALIDYDNDGWLDIFLVNGTTLEGFFSSATVRDRSLTVALLKDGQPTNHLYRNNRDGTFTDVTEKANLVRTGWGQGACVGDFDNDGYDDLLVTYYGQNVLYRNNGKGGFVDVTEKAGLIQKTTRWGTGCSFLDYDKDGHLDLFVANYVDFDIKKIPAKGSSRFCMWKGIPVMCGPRGLPGDTNILYHNNGDGTFTDVSEKSGITGPGARYAFTSLVSDFDNDGWPDIYVACDSTPNILYRNNGDGTFTDTGLISGTAFNEDGQEQAGMGVSAADYDLDGFTDIVKTNFADDTSTLYRNNGDGTFNDVTYQARLGVNTRFLGWGTGFFDFDNDGWKDILMVNGHVYPEVHMHATAGTYKQERLLYWNLRDGTFLDISAAAGPGIQDRRSSRGAAVGDLDNDGSLEIVVLNMNDTPSLLKDSGEKENWILIKTVGKLSNRNGIGARVTVATKGLKQTDEVRSGGSYLSQNDLRLHFGIGDATKIDRVEIHWPSGRDEVFEDLKANQVLVLEEGKGTGIFKDERKQGSRGAGEQGSRGDIEAVEPESEHPSTPAPRHPGILHCDPLSLMMRCRLRCVNSRSWLRAFSTLSKSCLARALSPFFLSANANW
ncbi:MAG: CRTAC1 family protein [Blastocatellia bacterium]|nr:CRTAC1 family protein [Blastocatellia bacterium]